MLTTNFIILTTVKRATIRVNVACIKTIQADPKGATGSVIEFLGDDKALAVRESPEEIMYRVRVQS